ncbi:MAG: sulfatase [Myxococcota bacterium]|nr:sulfatase [Myxococcota bacterium]
MRALLLALLAVLGCSAGSPPKPTHVLLLTIDTLRADHLGSYGYARSTSPHIDALAREGVLFSAAIVQRGATWPSLTSILTSLHPESHGVRQNGWPLPPTTPILSEHLREQGFRTAAFLTNMTSAPHRGFDHKETFEKEASDGTATRAALAWLRANHDRPCFLWLHWLGPHDPYAPSPEFRRRFATPARRGVNGRRTTLERLHRERRKLAPADLAHIVSLYDAEVAQVDARVGEVLAALDELGLRETTLVVLTSDHGEELYDHQSYFFHSNSIYDSVLRVPLVLRFPGALPAGLVLDGPTESIDIAPTIWDLLGLPPPASYEGRSLLPRIRAAADGEADGDGEAFSELGEHIRSIRTKRWHYLYNPREMPAPIPKQRALRAGESFTIEREELYDVLADPRETTNVVERHPDVAARLRRRIEERLARAAAAPPRAPEASAAPTPLDIPPETREELRRLGYLE